MQLAEQDTGKLGKVWFGFLGGGTAWVLHLMGTYAIAEFGCAGVLHDTRWLGINATCWILIAVSLALAGLAAASTWTAYRTERELNPSAPKAQDGETDERRPFLFAGHTGTVMSGWFLFIILVESIPTFFFLQGC
jgi:hypothetical protein